MTCKHLMRDTKDCVFCERDQLRGNLSLAEEGLANYQQEIERIQQEWLTWSMYCECTCKFCERLSSVIRLSVPQSSAQTPKA